MELKLFEEEILVLITEQLWYNTPDALPVCVNK